jgi:murein DD-endopeptidase MepM/ murein hydrolase activator NlpD
VLKTKIDDILHSGRTRIFAIRNRMTQGLAGRSRQVVVMATLAGIALIGFVAAAIDSPSHPDTSTTSAESQRDHAASQGNRSERDPQTPAPAEASPPSVVGPTETPGPVPTDTPPPSPEPEAKAVVPDWVLPMSAPISSCFGPRWGTMHQGLDFAGDAGTPIHAVGAGTIFAAGWIYSGYGISAVVDHGNGFLTHYAHMSELAVSPGQWVNAGDVIGYEGSTGDSTGPHLHFEVHQGMWNQVDPAPWMRDHGVPIDGC